VKVDSLGGSLGYAALPDPGQFATTIPGLAAGLAAGGAGGLPPATLPTLPNYPFFVSSDATTDPHQEIGDGPYRITATSKDGSGVADAAGGFRMEAAGNAFFVTSHAAVVPDAGDVVSTATSRVQALVLGPLTVGEVISSATETLGADGRTTPASSLQIAGLRIGGLPVSVTKDRLNLPGPSYPLPMDDPSGDSLKSSGISLHLVSAKSGAHEITAPAMVITAPAALAGFTDGGTMTIVLGGATASMDGNATSAPGLTAAPPAPHTTSAGTPGAGTTANTIAAPSTGVTGVPAEPAGPAGPVPELPTGSATVPTSGATIPVAASITYDTVVPAARSVPLGPGHSLDVRWMYLPVAVAAAAILGLGQLIQHLGVRRRWNSGVG
jgi:hypothetical protein